MAPANRITPGDDRPDLVVTEANVLVIVHAIVSRLSGQKDPHSEEDERCDGQREREPLVREDDACDEKSCSARMQYCSPIHGINKRLAYEDTPLDHIADRLFANVRRARKRRK